MSAEQPALWEMPSEHRAVRSWLWPSVASAVLCFLPLGLIAVYFGLRSQSAQASGDHARSASAARVARRWFFATVIVGLLVELGILAALLLLGAGG